MFSNLYVKMNKE